MFGKLSCLRVRVVQLDAAHMYGPFAGTFYALCLLDGNHKNNVLCWAIAPSESGSSTAWFLEHARDCLPNVIFALMSDDTTAAKNVEVRNHLEKYHIILRKCEHHGSPKVLAKAPQDSGLMNGFAKLCRARTEAFADAAIQMATTEKGKEVLQKKKSSYPQYLTLSEGIPGDGKTSQQNVESLFSQIIPIRSKGVASILLSMAEISEETFKERYSSALKDKCEVCPFVRKELENRLKFLIADCVISEIVVTETSISCKIYRKSSKTTSFVSVENIGCGGKAKISCPCLHFEEFGYCCNRVIFAIMVFATEAVKNKWPAVHYLDAQFFADRLLTATILEQYNDHLSKPVGPLQKKFDLSLGLKELKKILKAKAAAEDLPGAEVDEVQLFEEGEDLDEGVRQRVSLNLYPPEFQKLTGANKKQKGSRKRDHAEQRHVGHAETGKGRRIKPGSKIPIPSMKEPNSSDVEEHIESDSSDDQAELRKQLTETFVSQNHGNRKRQHCSYCGKEGHLAPLCNKTDVLFVLSQRLLLPGQILEKNKKYILLDDITVHGTEEPTTYNLSQKKQVAVAEQRREERKSSGDREIVLEISKVLPSKSNAKEIVKILHAKLRESVTKKKLGKILREIAFYDPKEKIWTKNKSDDDQNDENDDNDADHDDDDDDDDEAMSGQQQNGEEGSVEFPHVFCGKPPKRDGIFTKELNSGLKNLGNTCFMNAILQILFRDPSLAQFVRETGRSCQNLDCKICAYCSLALRNSSLQQFRNLFKNEFATGIQHDAKDFLLSLIGSLPALHSDDFLFDFDVQELRTHNGHEAVTERTFQIPYLADLYVEDNQKISAAFPNYFSNEFHEREESFCKTCNKDAPVLINTRMLSLPTTLIIHINRVFLNNVAGVNEKNINRVELEEYLEFEHRFLEKGLHQNHSVYALFGVCSHLGWSYNGGHYVSFVKCKDKNWRKFNDDFVTAEPNFLQDKELQCGAYLLFYTKLPDAEALEYIENQEIQEELEDSNYEPHPPKKKVAVENLSSEICSSSSEVENAISDSSTPSGWKRNRHDDDDVGLATSRTRRQTGEKQRKNIRFASPEGTKRSKTSQTTSNSLPYSHRAISDSDLHMSSALLDFAFDMHDDGYLKNDVHIVSTTDLERFRGNQPSAFKTGPLDISFNNGGNLEIGEGLPILLVNCSTGEASLVEGNNRMGAFSARSWPWFPVVVKVESNESGLRKQKFTIPKNLIHNNPLQTDSIWRDNLPNVLKNVFGIKNLEKVGENLVVFGETEKSQGTSGDGAMKPNKIMKPKVKKTTKKPVKTKKRSPKNRKDKNRKESKKTK